ncbi:MAG: DUF4870 domain-containing protein [Gammaproteobacteria bacterium]|nr:DUF4870 domain-containing protein [Gammaproteobacteria bacterium]MYF28914.1 DUF4870 domain-containing protein [Gammaproteobacteria bacterium]MYK48104.1 DUF4870 domain-containing protein [Gammaproteobacteria bacterium]
MADFDHSEMSSSEERTWSIIVHAAAFAGVVVPFGMILGPLVVWIIKKPESALVDRHGRAALNFQISMLIYFIGAVVLVFVAIGLLLLIVLGIFWFLMVLVATIRVADGRDPGYVLSIEFLK